MEPQGPAQGGHPPVTGQTTVGSDNGRLDTPISTIRLGDAFLFAHVYPNGRVSLVAHTMHASGATHVEICLTRSQFRQLANHVYRMRRHDAKTNHQPTDSDHR